MNHTVSAHVVSVQPAGAGYAVYFDGAGQWTADLHKAQIARSAAGRKAMLRVASALAQDAAIGAPALVEIDLPQAVPLAAA